MMFDPIGKVVERVLPTQEDNKDDAGAPRFFRIAATTVSPMLWVGWASHACVT